MYTYPIVNTFQLQYLCGLNNVKKTKRDRPVSYSSTASNLLCILVFTS